MSIVVVVSVLAGVAGVVIGDLVAGVGSGALAGFRTPGGVFTPQLAPTAARCGEIGCCFCCKLTNGDWEFPLTVFVFWNDGRNGEEEFCT